MLPISTRVTAALAAIQTTGEVACPLRGTLARDRCRELQLRKVCACPLGRVARLAGASEAIAEDREERRRAAALRQYSEPAKRWTLRCGYRCCGEEFTASKGYHNKPGYCRPEHAYLERAARKRDRKRLRESIY